MIAKRPATVLVVEDDALDRIALRRMLDPGYTLHEATSAADGARLVRLLSPECVLLDYRLPDGDGIALMEQLIAEAPDRGTAFVILTGHGDESVAVKALKGGAVDYLGKHQLERDRLAVAVRQALDRLDAEREERERRLDLERKARFDDLTGLLSRSALFDELSVAHARGPALGAAVLVVDLDGFKQVNDTHGHMRGDKLLVDIADAIRASARQDDLVGRWGGDEFIVLLRDTDIEGARMLAQRLLMRVEALSRPEEQIVVGCSVGIAAFSEADTPEALIELADQRLYSAKRAGGHRCAVTSTAEREAAASD